MKNQPVLAASLRDGLSHKTFKEFLRQMESSPSTRHALGIYPPMPGDAFARPGYSQAKFCQKVSQPGVKTVNMDTSAVCGAKGKRKRH